MRDRLIKLIDEKQVYGIDSYQPESHNTYLLDNDELADHLLEKGAIVLPCKVGDTIYFVSRGEIIPMVVNCISFNGNYQYCLNCNYADEEQYGYSLLTFTDKVRGYMFGFTREEAEKALERAISGA